MKTDWQDRLWNWTTAAEPYGYGQWNIVVEGLLDSLRSSFDIPFVFAGRGFYDIEHSTPRVVFSVTYEPENALLPRVVGRCGINTWTEDDDSRHIGVSVSFYYFQGEMRLIAENGAVVLEYEFTRDDQGKSIWRSNGWSFDYGESESCTWDDLKR